MPKVAISTSPADWPGEGVAPCARQARQVLTAAGYEVAEFPATGTGGRELEAAIANRLFAGVLDLALAELAAELVGGVGSAGPDRMTAASRCGVPQVIVPGMLDGVRFGSVAALPEELRNRRFYSDDLSRTPMRTTPEENDRLARDIALKVSAARGPAALLLPLRGLSALDGPGRPFSWPEANLALFQSIRNWISPHVRLVELDYHVNDAEFAKAAAEVLLEMLPR